LATKAIVERINHFADLLEEQPRMGRRTKRSDVLAHALVRYPYLVFYQILRRENAIRILRIQHAARRHPGFQEASVEFQAN
jgi:plasmid stabilization system protein ParE